jgi:DNA-binding NtrC family response regulator
MQNVMSRVLVIEDNDVTARLISATLTESVERIDVTIAHSATSGIEHVGRFGSDCVLLDYDLPDRNGLETLVTIRKINPSVPVIVVTGHGSEDVAYAFDRLGATDYVPKSKRFAATLVEKVRQALIDIRTVGSDFSGTTPSQGQESPFGKILGASAPLQKAIAIARQACATDAGVLIEGETGTGKDLLSRAIHDGSRRRSKAFLMQNCAAIPETLLESLLLGHTRGAFTGAIEARAGLLEEAHGGTLFLDEIGEASWSCQGKLLSVVDTGVVTRIGESQARPVDVRIIAATNRTLREDIQAGRFRSDLYHRLKVVTIRLPPLRERGDDIEILANAFLREFCQVEGRRPLELSRAAIRQLRAYDWPGNVRELRNEMHRLVVASRPEQRTIGTDSLDPAILQERPENQTNAPLSEVLCRTERETIEPRLRQFGGNRTATARSLGISREWLRQLIVKHGLS